MCFAAHVLSGGRQTGPVRARLIFLMRPPATLLCLLPRISTHTNSSSSISFQQHQLCPPSTINTRHLKGHRPLPLQTKLSQPLQLLQTRQHRRVEGLPYRLCINETQFAPRISKHNRQSYPHSVVYVFAPRTAFPLRTSP